MADTSKFHSNQANSPSQDKRYAQGRPGPQGHADPVLPAEVHSLEGPPAEVRVCAPVYVGRRPRKKLHVPPA